MFHRSERLLLRPPWPEDWKLVLGGIADEGRIQDGGLFCGEIGIGEQGPGLGGAGIAGEGGVVERECA